MPTLLNENGYRFAFYMADLDEPPHVHVTRERMMVKVWLDPLNVGRNAGFPELEIRRILRLCERHRDAFLETWNDALRNR